MYSFNELNWYWVVAGSTTQVYSSARDIFCSLSDSTYQAWLAAGYQPTPISSSDMALTRIDILEQKITPRMQREALIGSTAVFPTGSPYAGLTSMQAITAINNQIATLRAGL